MKLTISTNNKQTFGKILQRLDKNDVGLEDIIASFSLEWIKDVNKHSVIYHAKLNGQPNAKVSLKLSGLGDEKHDHD